MNRIRFLKKEMGLTNREVEEKTGVAQTLVSMIESGKRKMTSNTAIKLSELFHVTLDFLYDRSDFGILVEHDFGGGYISLADYMKYKESNDIFYIGDRRLLSRKAALKRIREEASNKKETQREIDLEEILDNYKEITYQGVPIDSVKIIKLKRFIEDYIL